MRKYCLLGLYLGFVSCASGPTGLRVPASQEAYQAQTPLSQSGKLPEQKRKFQITRSTCRCLPATRREDAPVLSRVETFSVRAGRPFQEDFDVDLNVLSALRRAHSNSSLVLSDYEKVLGENNLILNRRSFVIFATKISKTDSRPYRCKFEAEIGQISQALRVTDAQGEVHYLSSRDEPAVSGLGKLTVAFGVQAFEGHELFLQEDTVVEAENHRPSQWRYVFDFNMTAAVQNGGHSCHLENHDTVLLPDSNS